MSVPWWVIPQSVMTTAVHGYLWWRLVRSTTAAGSRARRIGSFVMTVLAASIPAALVAIHVLDPSAARWLAWPGFVWYAAMVYLILLLLVAEPVLAVLAIARRRHRRSVKAPAEVAVAPTGPSAAIEPARESVLVGVASPGHPRSRLIEAAAPRPPCPPDAEAPSPGRRLLLARSIALAVGAGTAGIVGAGMSSALGPPHVRHTAVRLRRLPHRAAGFRIALVSDIHLGAMLGRSHTRRIVDLVNQAAPDLVAIVGDLIDGTVEQLDAAAEPLTDLRSRHGTFFVTGNHEYIFGAGPWVAELRELGVHPLQNERVELPGFDLAGVNDVSGAEVDQGPDYERALGDRDPSRPVVLLAHQPVQVHEAAKRGVDLQLSGHTHGGQLFPLSLATAAVQPALAGWKRFADTQLYVTRGAGFWGPPVRVGAPPDITVIELRD